MFPKNNSGTQKRVRKNKNLKALWNTFESEKSRQDKNLGKTSKSGFHHSDYDTSKDTLECIYSNSTDERTNCEYCDSLLQVTEMGFLCCSNTKCGILYKDIIDQSAEWRYYGANDSNNRDPTRCGMPTTEFYDPSSFGCKVVCNSRSSYEMRKISRYTETQYMSYRLRIQYEDFEHIKTMANIAGISKIIIDDAMRTYTKIAKERETHSLNRHAIIAASIYIASRIHNCPRTAKEIATIFHLETSSATNGCKNASLIINKADKTNTNVIKTKMCAMKPTVFIERYCTGLDMNKELIDLCKFIAWKIETGKLIPENTPNSIAAGIVYFVSQKCNINLCKSDVNRVTEISEVTITKCYKKLETMAKKILPQMIIDKYSLLID